MGKLATMVIFLHMVMATLLWVMVLHLSVSSHIVAAKNHTFNTYFMKHGYPSSYHYKIQKPLINNETISYSLNSLVTLLMIPSNLLQLFIINSHRFCKCFNTTNHLLPLPLPLMELLYQILAQFLLLWIVIHFYIG